MIQIIGEKKYSTTFKSSEIVISSFNEPQSLDMFDVNVIDFQCEGIWRNEGNSYKRVNISDDIKSLDTMIRFCCKTKIVICFPRNYNFSYNWYSNNNRYLNSMELKNIMDDIKDILGSISYGSSHNLLYENTQTQLNNISYAASFYFNISSGVLTKSKSSDKCTTYFSGRFYYTTLDFFLNSDTFFNYLRCVGCINDEYVYPEWIDSVYAFDDAELNRKIQANQELIAQSEIEITQAKRDLAKNLRYKSILFTNGNELVEVVFEMLESLLDYSLEAFKDEKKEDFLIKKENITFIGEIKGVTSNVKSLHISQTEVHYQSYLEDLLEEGITENVKQILIINPLRNTPIDKREAIHEIQISLAERNGCLVIETATLLKLFERFKAGEISSDECIEICRNTIGLLKL